MTALLELPKTLNTVVYFGLRDTVDELLCAIEVSKMGDEFVAKLQTQLGGNRELRGKSFEEMLEQLTLELLDEFEGTS